MKKIILMVVAAVMATCAFAQETIKKVRIYKGETIAYEEIYADVDSIVFVEVPTLPAGALKGEFSVSDTKKVHFSKGNLQASTTDLGEHWTWGFATNQWDYIGNFAANNTINGNGTVSDNGSIDIFKWSTDDTYYGINNSTDNSNYSGNFKDWGETMGNDWYTLSKDEWVYMFHERDKADELFGMGSVNGINGTFILPDDWTLPDGITFNTAKDKNLLWDTDEGAYNNNNFDNYSHNTFTAEQWSKLEEAGVVFLPAAGYGGTLNGVQYAGLNGGYWSSTPDDKNYVFILSFYEFFLHPQDYYTIYRYSGESVRLVIEAK